MFYYEHLAYRGCFTPLNQALLLSKYVCTYLDMPNVSTYVRTEDYEEYLAIQKKGNGAWTEFIHNALRGVQSSGVTSASQKEVGSSPALPTIQMACCLQNKPCKHWHYDGVTTLWTNELTGEIKEVS